MLKKVMLIFLTFAMLTTVAFASQSKGMDIKQSYAKIKVVDSVSREIISDVIIRSNPINNKLKSIKLEYKGQDLYVENLELGKYDWKVEAKGYKTAKFSNYPIVDGGNVYVFELSKKDYIEKDYLDIINRRKEVGQHSDEHHPEFNEKNSQESNAKNKIPTDDFSIMSIPKEPPSVPTSLKVNYNGNIINVPLEDYVAHVINREMDPAYYIYNSLTSAQKLEALKAQAVAARTYALYRHYVWTSRHSGYDVCSDVHCQVYDPVYSPQLAIDAANKTAKQILIKVTDYYNWNYQYTDTVFSASCLGETKNSEDVSTFGSYVSYLRGVTCPYDIRPTEDLGHNVGLCQDGAAGYAKNGYYYSTILNHYYTGLDLETGQ